MSILETLGDILSATLPDARILDSRADFAAWVSAGNTPVAGRTYWVGGLPFLGLIGATATGMAGLTPHPKFPVTPDHFAENTVPGSTDMTAAIQAALATKLLVVPMGTTYGVSSEIVIDNGYKLVGAGGHWKRRTGFTPTQGSPTVFKWIGDDAPNTAVVRVSRKPVGDVATSITPPNGDDLVDFELRDIHVDCDNKARFGFYMYRCGNNATVGGLTAEKARLRNFLIMGVYAAQWGHFGAYESESHGVGVGEDYFDWNSVESTCFAFSANFHLVNNGTNGTYIKGTVTDLSESGGVFRVGRGSHIRICSESNFGRAFIASTLNGSGYADGPSIITPEYIEANGDGPRVEITNNTFGFELRDGFLHPGNSADPVADRFSGSLKPQDITISATSAGGGVTEPGQVLRIHNMIGHNQGVGFGIDSNTVRYEVDQCPQGIVFVAMRPGFGDAESVIGGLEVLYVAAERTGTGSGANASNRATWEDAVAVARVCSDVLEIDVSAITSTSAPAASRVFNGAGVTREIKIEGGGTARLNSSSGDSIAVRATDARLRFSNMLALERCVIDGGRVTFDACPLIRTGANASALAAVFLNGATAVFSNGSVVDVTQSTAANKKAVSVAGGSIVIFSGAGAGTIANYTTGHAITFSDGGGMVLVSAAIETAAWAGSANIAREAGGDAGFVIAGGVVNP